MNKVCLDLLLPLELKFLGDTVVMAKQSLSSILIKVEAGKFSQTLELLKSIKLDKQKALYIFHVASKACRIVAEDCDIPGIEKLCNILMPYLDTLEEPDLTNYFRSLYYIMKLVCNCERFVEVPKMKAILIPNFIKEDTFQTSQEPAGVYVAIINLLSESVYRLGRAKNTSFNKYVLEILELLLQARNKLNSLKDLMDLVDLCYKILHVLEATNDQLLTFYNIALEVVSSKFGKLVVYATSIQVRLARIVSYILCDAIKSENFGFAEKFLDVVESSFENFMMLDGFIQTHIIFKAVTSLFPHSESEMEKSMNKTKIFLNDFKSTNKNLFYNTIYFLDQPLRDLLLFYEKSGLQIWHRLSETSLLNISQFIIDDLICHSMIYSKECSCGCTVTKNYYSMLDIGCLLVRLLKSSITEFENPSNEYLTQIGKMFNQLYAVVKKLKAAECQKWMLIYDKLSADNWNISMQLFKSNHACLRGMVRCFLINGFELDGVHPSIRTQQIYTFAFTALCKFEINQKNWLSCMGMAALHCLLYTQNSNSVFDHYWVESKIKNKADVDIQQQTLLSILDAEKKQLSHILNFESLLTESKKIELLVFELGRYKSIWMSKLTMMATFSHLIEIADVSKIAEVFVDIYGDGSVAVHLDYSCLFAKVKDKFKTFLKTDPSNSVVKLALAAVYFYIFKLSCKEAVEKNKEEMALSTQVMESVEKRKQIEPIPKDPDDECDIVSAYTNLQLSKFIKLLKSLNTCVDIISELINVDLQPEAIKNVANLLTLVGFEYRLHCISVKSLSSFHMSMKYSEKIENHQAWLFALSLLIESADVTQQFVIELIRKGDELAALIQNVENDEGCSKTLATYYLYKSKAFLINNPNLSYEAWKIADSICAANEDKRGFPILRAQLHVLLHKLTKSCNFIEGHHEKAPMTYHLHLAHDIVIELIQNTVVASYELSVILDTIYELSKIYSLMRLPRDVRPYAKYTVLLTQKIVLPVRCISFLILLAHCDLATGNFDHYNVKLNGIDDIFSLNQFKSSVALTEHRPMEIETKKYQDDVDQCSSLIRELVLDPAQHIRQFAPSSPPFVVESFKFPEFLSHKKGCGCFICLSIECQDLLLKKYHLTALANMYEQQNELAEEYTVGSLSVYKKLVRNFAGFKSKVSKLIPEPIIPTFENTFTECYANILYDYSSHMYRTSRKSEALKISSELIKVLETKKDQYVYLYQDVLLLRLICFAPDDKALKPVKSKSETLEVNNLNIPTTPINKIASITLKVNGIEHCTPPRQRRNKCNLFNTKPDSTDLRSNTAKSQVDKNTAKNQDTASALPVRKCRKATITAPVTPFTGTAAPKTIDIFTDDSADPGPSTRKPRLVKKIFELKKPELKKSSSNSIGNMQSHEPITCRATTSRTRSQLKKQNTDGATSSEVVVKSSTRLRQKLTDELMKDKAESERNDSSIIPNSPENTVYAEKKKDLLAKIKSSATKAKCKGK